VLRHRIIASVSTLEAWESDPPMPIAFSTSAFRPDAATPSLLVKCGVQLLFFPASVRLFFCR